MIKKNNKTYGIETRTEYPELVDVTITENGTYNHTGEYGYDEVTVEVPDPVLQTLNATANDTYTPSAGVDGYNEVVVNVQPNLTTLNATQNTTYTPTSPVQGYDEVVVNVTPNLQNKSINANGSYTADQGYDGLGTVTVNVSSAVWPDYLTATYFVSEPSNSFEILNNTNNVSGWRFKGASTWESPATSITVTGFGSIEIEFQLVDNTTLSNMFTYCTNLIKVDLPASVTSFGQSCFFDAGLYEFPNLTNITSIGEDCFYGQRLQFADYVINDNVDRSGYHPKCFNGAWNWRIINKFYVNGMVYHIGQPASNSDLDLTNGLDGLTITKWRTNYEHYWTLNSLKFPSTLISLTDRSLQNSNIGDLYFYGTTPPVREDFDGGSIWQDASITNIYVPAASLTAYQNSAAFADVVSKIQAMP